MSNLSFINFSDIERDAPYEVIPAGSYDAMIVSADLGDTKSGDGKYLKLCYKLTSGPYEGRLIFEYLNISHANADTQRISRARLARLCDTLGISPSDSSELVGHSVKITVTVEKRRDNGEMANRVKAYLPNGGSASGSNQPRQVNAPPWKQSK